MGHSGSVGVGVDGLAYWNMVAFEPGYGTHLGGSLILNDTRTKGEVGYRGNAPRL